MTQRERLPEHDDNRAEVYETPTQTRTYQERVVQAPAPQSNIDVVTPVDRVRWGPVIAGLFAALATLAALTILGLAIGAAAFDPGATASSFGLGAGIWGAVSVLLAFFVGGWLAARTAAVAGRGNGLLNGAMVWFVAIPLLLYSLGSGVGAITRTLGSVAGTAAAVVAPAAGQAADQAANNPALQATAQAGAQDAAGAVQQQAQQLQQQASDPQNQQAIADSVSANAWRVLLSLGLAAAAALAGGMLGARHVDERRGLVGG